MAQRPGELGVHVQRQHAILDADDLAGIETVEPHQPVGLVEPMLADQGWCAQWQRTAGIRDRAEGGVIDPLQFIGAVQVGRGRDDGPVGRGIRADDHLRALSRRRKARADIAARRDLPGLARLVELQPQPAHGAADGADVLLRRQRRHAGLFRHLDVDAEPVGIFAGFGDQRLVGFRNRLEMDVALEMPLTQFSRDGHDLFHRVVRVLDDARRQEQALDIIAAIEVERQRHDLVDGEAGALHVARGAVDAIQAIEVAGIGEQDLQQRDAAAVRRVRMANPHAGRGGAHALAVAAVLALAAAGRAGRVVFGGIRQDRQLALHVHYSNPFDSIGVKNQFGRPV